MALDRFEVRISIQKVLLGLVLVIVPLSIVGLYLTVHSNSALDASIGTHLKDMAQMYSSDVSHQLNDRVARVKLIAADPGVVEAVATANRAYEKQSETAINDKLDKEDKAWNGPAGAAKVKALLESKPSETLGHYHDMDPQVLTVTVTDLRGVPVAATAKPGRYRLNTWDPWQAVYAGGKGAVSISNMLYDEPTKAYFVNLGVPVTDAKTANLIGVAVASVDISPILASFQQDSTGNTDVTALLVNENGTVVSGPKTDIFARVHSDEFDAVRDAMGTAEGRQLGYVLASLRRGGQIIGFADTGLQKTYKNFGWTVLVSEDDRVATGPIRVLSQFAVLMVILALFMVTLLAVYYALHRKQQFADIEAGLRGHQTLSSPPPHAV
jgi:Cache domain